VSACALSTSASVTTLAHGGEARRADSLATAPNRSEQTIQRSLRLHEISSLSFHKCDVPVTIAIGAASVDGAQPPVQAAGVMRTMPLFVATHTEPAPTPTP